MFASSAYAVDAPADVAAGACDTFIEALRDARIKYDFEDRFPEPHFELADTKTTEGQTLHTERVVSGAHIHVTCDHTGQLASLLLLGPSAYVEDDDRMTALIVSALAATLPIEAEGEPGEKYWEMYSNAHDDLLRDVQTGSPMEGTFTSTWGKYSLQFSLFSDKLVVFEVAANGYDFLSDVSDLGSTEAFDEYQKDYLAQWRCTPHDLHGSVGMMWTGPAQDVLPPTPPRGWCTVRVTSAYMRQDAKSVEGRTVEMLQMRCFRQGEAEYHCVPSERSFNPADNYLTVISRSFTDASRDVHRELLCESYESSLLWDDCLFDIQFVNLSGQPSGMWLILGTDHIYAFQRKN